MDALIRELRETVKKANELLSCNFKSKEIISIRINSLEEQIERLEAKEQREGVTDESDEIWLTATSVRTLLLEERAHLDRDSSLYIEPSASSVITSSTLPEYLKRTKKKNFCIRRMLYLEWSNSVDVKSMFRDMIRLIRNYFEQNVVIFNDVIPNRDILDSIMDEKLLKEPVNVKKIEVILQIFDYPISTPVFIAERILRGYRRTSATSILKEVGCQHVFLHNKMVDSSSASSISSPESESRKRKTPSNSNSTADELSAHADHTPKKLKTCQLACWVDCGYELRRHQTNYTSVKGTPIIVDVLFFIPKTDVLEKLAIHLGLISIDKIVREAGIEADLEEVLQLRMDNPDAKVYRLIQAYINRDLMFGRSNVCITSNESVFEIVNANVKVALLQESESVSYSIVHRFSSMVVDIPDEAEIFHYITGVAEVMENILKSESINVTYCSSDKYYNLKLPLCSVIPLYILRFFSQILISKSNMKFNYLDIE